MDIILINKKTFVAIEWGEHKKFKAYFSKDGVEISKPCDKEKLEELKKLILKGDTTDTLYSWKKKLTENQKWLYEKIKKNIKALGRLSTHEIRMHNLMYYQNLKRMRRI